MKKFLSLIFVLAAVTLSCAFSACDKNTVGAELVEADGNIAVIRATRTDTSKSLADAMEYLKDKGKLEYTAETGAYGLQILSVNGYTPQNNEFWAVYTTLGEFEGLSYSDSTWGVFDYGDITCNSAAFGVSQMPLVKDELYILAVSSY